MAGLHIQRLIIELIVIAFRITSNPLVTGPLLYILTRRTDQSGIILKAHFTKQINRLPTEVNLEKIVKILKYLFVLGFVPKANAFLNTISQNNWLLTAPTSEWVWEKEVAVITGGSAGIGEQVVLRLIRKGVRVAILDISPPTHPELKNDPKIDYIKTDVTDPDAINTAATYVKSKWGPPTILINNAGIGTGQLIINNTPEYIQKIFGVNIFSHFYTVKAFLPDMISRNHGHIIAIASMASFISVPGIADYAATKAGLLSFHEALKEEIIQVHKAPKVLTTIIHPSWTMTALTAKDADLIEKTQGPLLTAATVADAIVKPLFSATGRQVIIPDKLTPLSTVKGWPNWMQDKFRGIVGRLSVGELLKK